MTSWPVFHGALTSYFGHIIMVKIFLPGRILNSRAFRLSVRAYVRQSVYQVKILSKVSRPINGSKLIFHMRMCLWDQQEYTRAMTSWPIFHDPLTLFAWRLFDGRLLYWKFTRREAAASVYFGHISSFYHLSQLRAHLVRISLSDGSEKFIGRGYRTGICCISGVHHISTYLFWKWR